MYKVENTTIEGVKRIIPKIYSDERGSFIESFKLDFFKNEITSLPFIQENISTSKKGVIRGLHHQWRKPQGKLVTVGFGAVLDVIVDIRHGSPTFGQVETFELNSENKHLIYIPPNFLHGFQVLSEIAVFTYKCTDVYDPGYETTVLYNDATLAINWVDIKAIISDKDSAGQFFINM